MLKSQVRARRRWVLAALRLETLEDRSLFNVTPTGVADFGSLTVDPGEWNPSQILVRFRPGLDPNATAVMSGTTLGSALPLVDDLWTVRLAPGVSVQEALATYKSHPSVAYAQEDFRVRITAPVIPNDPRFGELWGLNNTGQAGGTPDADIDAPEAWAVTTGSRDVVVAVIDTGVDYNHPDLKANMWTNPGEYGRTPGVDDDGNGFVDDIYGADFVNNDGDPFDDYGHGTHVAGTIGAQGNDGVGVAGVNWNVRIMALKFLDASGAGYTSGAIAALNYAVAKGAKVSNNSWGGGGFDQALYNAIKQAGETAGHIFVAAAGNDGSNNDAFPFYPAGYDLPNVIAVAATDRNDALASFSNYGATTVDLGAPGVDILSTVPLWFGNGSGYAVASGTSMATPHVTGVVALLQGLHPDWGYGQIKEQLLSSVDPLSSLAGKTVTGGRLNAANAVGVDFAPRVVGQSPSGSTTGPVSSLQLTFSEDVTGFTREDISRFVGPGGVDLLQTITDVSGSGTTYTVNFAAQSALGDYSMDIGPDIRDASNQPMDQNRNGVPGEAGDIYTAKFTISDELIFPSSDVPADIFAGYTTVSYLTITDERYSDVTIADLNLQLTIEYPDVYDLNLSLYSPAGTFVPLVWWNPYVYGKDFQNTTFDDQADLPISSGQAPYTGSFRPDGNLSDVNGEGILGTWELHIDAWPFTDPFNFGQLTAWSLIIDPQRSSNKPPVAVNDSYSTDEDTRLTVEAPGVLGNDSDPDGDTLTAVLVSGPSHGTLTLNANGSFTYTPNANYNGDDRFTYKANDGKADSNIATVSITVKAVNDPPKAVNDSYSTNMGTTLTVAAPGVLANDSDVDGDKLTAVLVTGPSHGTLTLNANGSFTYTPDANFTGTDSFTYKANDGTTDSNVATVNITVQSLYYFSLTTGGTIGGVSFTDADILRLAVGGGKSQLSLYFDGSDVGLTGNQTAEDIDAFAFLPDGSIVLSTVGPFSVSTTYSSPGVGSGPTLTGTGADLLRFWPESLGVNTSGSWEFYFDGSDVGLDGSNENIDGVAVLADDRIVISTSGTFSVSTTYVSPGVGSGPTVTGQDEDLLAFDPTGLSGNTTGAWKLYFDGSAVGLGESSSEDVDALFISESEDENAPPTLYFSTVGNFSVPNLRGGKEDVFAFHPTSGSSEPFDRGTFGPGLTLDGSLYGLAAYNIDGIYLGLAPNEGSFGPQGNKGPWGGRSQDGEPSTVAPRSNSSSTLLSDDGGSGAWNSSPAKPSQPPTHTDGSASLIAALTSPAEAERPQGTAPRATTREDDPLPGPSASVLSAQDYIFALGGSLDDAALLSRSGRAAQSMDMGGGLEDGLFVDALWAWFVQIRKRAF